MANKHMERRSTLLIITKMQIKTIIRHHPKLISMTMVKKKPQINAEKDVEKGEHTHTIGGNVNWSRHCGKNMEVSQKTKNRAIVWHSNSTPGYISKKTKNTYLKRYMHPNVHRSVIYICQSMKAT